jgi:hypothetical protein
MPSPSKPAGPIIQELHVPDGHVHPKSNRSPDKGDRHSFPIEDSISQPSSPFPLTHRGDPVIVGIEQESEGIMQVSVRF